jgi:hypothetical protein
MAALIITDLMGGDFGVDVVTAEGFSRIVEIGDELDEHDIVGYNNAIFALLYGNFQTPTPTKYVLAQHHCQVWVIENLGQKYEIKNILFLRAS